MKYKFQVGELVRVRQSDIGLVTARRRLQGIGECANKYTIITRGITITAWEHGLRKVNKNDI